MEQEIQRKEKKKQNKPDLLCVYQFPVEHAHCTKANKKYTYMDTGKIHAVSMKYTAVAAVVQPFKSLNVCVQIESGCAVEWKYYNEKWNTQSVKKGTQFNKLTLCALWYAMCAFGLSKWYS